MKRLSIKNFHVEIGGEQHTGWLPDNATPPLPVPTKKLLCDLEIEEIENGGGFLLLYHSKSKGLHGDTWHETIEAAMDSAQKQFDVSVELWKQIK